MMRTFESAFDGAEDVPDIAVHLDGQRRFGQPRPDGGGNVCPGGPARERQRLAIRKGDSQFTCRDGRGHGLFP